ncbi:hypothetical protein N7462_006342 [Penicillium macrosclerotiorum]|uniref:uncharacterized protein n=1 Tax=Penicillium macrosclerotiorum TaxID=303699 RepID=UPI0025478AA7|nr:uncharacterized protein N7462_006342 [Penicillium macrosclerotiorum]KAJ5683177.1 hypothetical protein N7462_006342 [Penicillium macrosclerotiorum]
MDTTLDQTRSPDNVNDLFDYDVGLDEIFQAKAVSNADSSKPTTGNSAALGLGLDEEVKVTKKRQPIAKLDEERLLSQSGIPKLRHIAKQKLRFKGKGHEFSDAARLLSFYQLWLDDLFPRAKFADGLTMIEKLGHTKRIQTMRREWIEEEKPRRLGDHEPLHYLSDGKALPIKASSDYPSAGHAEPQDQPSERRPQHTTSTPGIADQDLFMPDPEGQARPLISHPESDYDDLDDLLREQDDYMSGEPDPVGNAPNTDADSFDAEYEAMQEFGM